jgi:hypothetical protein
MKSPLTKIAAGTVASIALVAGAAHAATFDFSYTYGIGDTVTGSFSGTGPVTAVTNITNISVKVDGTPLLGPLSAWSYTSAGSDCPTCFVAGGAVASSIADNNNFLFTNGATNYFYLIPWPNGDSNPEAVQALLTYNIPGHTDLYNGQYYLQLYNGTFVPGNWSLTEVPEPAAWALMLVGFAGLGAAMRAARRRSLAAA